MLIHTQRRYVLALLMLFVVGSAFGQQDTTIAPPDTTIRSAVDSIVSETPIEEVISAPDRTTTFTFSPNIGFTYGKISNDGEESENLQWQMQVQSRFSYEGEPQQFNSTLFAQYGAQVSADAAPVKTQDNLILTVVPSRTLVKELGLRLFFEITGETEMGKGMIDTVETTFLDPLFLYESLFLGHKTHIFSEDESEEFEFIIGAGYAYQQTITNKFILAQNRQFIIDENNPLSKVQDQFTVEKGYSGILELAYSNNITDDLTFRMSSRTVALTKDRFSEGIENSRVGSLLLAGIQYSIFSIDYTMHILYDRNISPRRSLDQSMVFGLRFDL